MDRSDEDDTQLSFVGPHEGRELELMLEGKKHLSMFLIEDTVEYENYPDKQFDTFVSEGKFLKDVRVAHYPSFGGTEITARNILYASTGEGWRIPAMRMIQDIYENMGPGWRPDLERAIGSLLGYDRNDVELFIERHAKLHGKPSDHDPCRNRASTFRPP